MSRQEPEAALPTYRTVAGVLERKNGSGLRLVGWTLARTILIAPPMIAVGVKPKQAFAGAALASILITMLAMLRLYNAGDGGAESLGGSRRRALTRR